MNKKEKEILEKIIILAETGMKENETNIS